jgi:hypothetical protein
MIKTKQDLIQSTIIRIQLLSRDKLGAEKTLKYLWRRAFSTGYDKAFSDCITQEGAYDVLVESRKEWIKQEVKHG